MSTSFITKEGNFSSHIIRTNQSLGKALHRFKKRKPFNIIITEIKNTFFYSPKVQFRADVFTLAEPIS